MHTLEQLRSGALAGTRRLDLACDLTELPAEIFALADTLEVLNLSGNRLRHLPHQLSRLYKLQVLFASDNEFEVLPEVLGDGGDLFPPDSKDGLAALLIEISSTGSEGKRPSRTSSKLNSREYTMKNKGSNSFRSFVASSRNFLSS